MKAMILAAGFGTRLRPLTNSLPKPLLPVGGIPLIVWNLLLLRAHGIREIIINLHYLGHQIEKVIGNGSPWGMHVSYSHEPEILGTGGGLKAAEWFFKGQPFLVMNGDTLIDLDLRAFMKYHEERQGEATLVLRDDPEVEHWGAVECDFNNRILRINGKGIRIGPDPEGPIFRRMFAGVHIIDPRLIKNEPSGTSFSIINTYTKALCDGLFIFGYIHEGYWSDVGTKERYAEVQRDAQAGRISLMTNRQSDEA